MQLCKAASYLEGEETECHNEPPWTKMCTSRLFMYKIWCWVLANIGSKRLKGLLRRMLGSTYKHWGGATNVGEQLQTLANIVEQRGNFGEQD